MKKIYPLGYSNAAVDIMNTRSAKDNAGLFLQYVKPGARILDVGCGPGSITMGLATELSPSEVVGIDIEPSQIEMAQALAKERNLKRCQFHVANIFELPFEDNSFDAVYGHTILMHFDDTRPALEEIKRVLKPGGIVGLREVDFSSNVFGPKESSMKKLMDLFRQSFIYNGSNPDIGRDLPLLLSRLSYDVCEFKLSYSQATTPNTIEPMYDSMISLWEQAEFPDQAVQLGWISEEEKDALPKDLKQESTQAGTINGICYVEAVATNS